jgi:hypothetical protein
MKGSYFPTVKQFFGGRQSRQFRGNEQKEVKKEVY